MTRRSKSTGRRGRPAKTRRVDQREFAAFADKVLEKLAELRIATIGSDDLHRALLARLDRLDEKLADVLGHVKVIPDLATKLDGAAQCSQSSIDAVMQLRQQLEAAGVIIARVPRAAVRSDRR